jgi:autotransporter-associated beta strand protein
MKSIRSDSCLVHRLAAAALSLGLFAPLVPTASAEFLFGPNPSDFPIPAFAGDPDTEYSQWGVFYSANLGGNYPDVAAPNGVFQTASAAGFTPPAGSSPANPLAYWHLSNPTLTQTVPGVAFIIGPGTAGNIYSFAEATSFRLQDTTPYTLGTVVFQFQTEGTPVDFDSIVLRYDNGSGPVDLAPGEFLREYRSSASAFGGNANRVALQWDLSSLGISSYEILFTSEESSMSFQQAVLDTAKDFVPWLPALRTWNSGSNGVWSNASSWQQGSTSVANGNVRFENPNAVSIALDSARTVGEIFFASPENVTITGASTLTANTGISTTSAATGIYTVASPYEFGAFQVMDIEAGEVRLEGVVSGAYGMSKEGAGRLVLANNNTFTGGVGVQGGALRMEGQNSYTGTTAVLWGTLEVAANAPTASAGALGNASSAVILGANSATFSTAPEAARILIDGDHTVSRNIQVEAGTFQKAIGATGTTSGALITGNVTLSGTTSGFGIFAENAGDVLRLNGNLSGGAASATIQINEGGAGGTVVFSGSNKTYASNTNIHAGTLLLASGTATTGNGAWSVASGASLVVDGTLGGAGALTLANGATLGGSGTVNKTLAIGNGVTLSPGNSPGTMNTASQTWAGGGSYLWEINDVDAGAGSDPGWDWLNITGTLDISATNLNPFNIQITSLSLANIAGNVHDFADLTSYSWAIASASGGITGFDAGAFHLDISGFQNSFTGSFGLEISGSSLVLTYTPIPEPSTWLLVGCGLAGVFLLRSMRRNRRTN